MPDVKQSPYLHHVGSVFTGSAPAFKAPGGICAAPEVTGLPNPRIFMSSGGGLLPARPPLRTVLESFPSYGSSRSNRCALCGHAAATERRAK